MKLKMWRTPVILGSLFILGVVCLAWFGISFLNGSEIKTLGIKRESGVINYVIPPKIEVNQPFQVAVEIDTKNARINAVGLYLNFDPTTMQLLQLDTRSSFCQFYPDKKYDNRLGTINLACGSPHPGFAGTNTMMTLEFMPIKVGTTHIFTNANSQILKSDGKGTNILKAFPTADIQIGNTP